MDRTLKFLKQNIKEEPTRIIDVCCGSGDLVGALSSYFPHSTVYGLDIDRSLLANGIAKGNFKRAFPIHGNAYHLGEENNDFTSIHLKPEYFSKGYVDWMKTKHRRLKKPLKNFDMITTVNPASELSPAEINKLIGKEKLDKDRGFIPLDIISIPAKKGGHVLYATEIANVYAGIYGGLIPQNVNEKIVEDYLAEMKKEGEKTGLNYVSYDLEKIRSSGHDHSVNLGVLFKKL